MNLGRVSSPTWAKVEIHRWLPGESLTATLLLSWLPELAFVKLLDDPETHSGLYKLLITGVQAEMGGGVLGFPRRRS